MDSADYGYNAGNQRITFTNAAGTWVTNSYDLIGQLQMADSSVSSEDRGYTYDAAWNLNYRTNNGVLSTFKVDPQNQLTNAPGIGRQSYDGNGNLVQGHAAGPDYFYTYDDENRLVAVEREEVWRIELIYDGQGRLRLRKEYDFTDDWNLTSETRYLYDGMRVIQERDGSNVPTVSYTRGTDLSGSLEGAGGIGGLLARSHGHSSGNWSTHNFYHADGNGNITFLVDSSQALAASYRYDPFGNTLSSSGSLAADNAYRFSSKEVHVASGLYYYGYRFYDPNVQRWLNQDPIQEHGGLNLYAFVNNRPTMRVDAFGLVADWDGYSKCVDAAEDHLSYCMKFPVCAAKQVAESWPGARQAAARLRKACGGPLPVRIICLWAVYQVGKSVDKAVAVALSGATGWAAGCLLDFLVKNDACRTRYLDRDITPMQN